jgi:hypothetical protein
VGVERAVAFVTASRSVMRGLCVALLFLLIGVACQSGQPGQRMGRVIRQVEVINDHRSDVNVYAVVGSQRYRLGTVNAKLRASFEIPRAADLVSQDLYLRLVTIGEAETFELGPIVAMGGRRIELVIAPRLVNSRALVR